MANLVKFESSSSIVKEADLHKSLSKGLTILDGQSDMQADQLSEQLQILYNRAKDLQERRRISQIIYSFDFGFQPLVKQTYHLYRSGERTFLSMIGPTEWTRRTASKLNYIATVMLEYDHTWKIIELKEDIFFTNANQNK